MPAATRSALLSLAVMLAAAALPAAADAGTAELQGSGTQGVGATTLVYTGAPGQGNQLTLDFEPGSRTYDVADSAGVVAGSGCTAVDPTRVRCVLTATAAVEGPLVNLGDGADSATVAGTRVRLSGGAGDDRLRGDPTLGAAFVGGPGNDQMVGGSGVDVFDEEAVRNGGDAIDGGAGGSDEVSYAQRRRALQVDLSRGGGERGEGDRISNVERVLGGRGGDRLVGDRAGNVLAGGGGADLLRGLAGDDELGADTTRMRPGRGGSADRLEGGAGQDTLAGNAGRNRLSGGSGADLILAGGGRDTVRARDRSIDELRCGRGRDRAVLDAFDFFSGGCERVRRTRAAAATLLGLDTTAASGGTAVVEVGCPRDVGHACTGRLSLRHAGGRVGAAGFRVRRGGRRFVRIRLPGPFMERLTASGSETVSVILTTKPRTGATRSITLRLALVAPGS